MVTLCLGDNALVIHTHYSNGCWYKDLLTLGWWWWGWGGVASRWLNAACILRPLSSPSAAARPLPSQLPSLIQPLLEWWWWWWEGCVCAFCGCALTLA